VICPCMLRRTNKAVQPPLPPLGNRSASLDCCSLWACLTSVLGSDARRCRWSIRLARLRARRSLRRSLKPAILTPFTRLVRPYAYALAGARSARPASQNLPASSADYLDPWGVLRLGVPHRPLVRDHARVSPQFPYLLDAWVLRTVTSRLLSITTSKNAQSQVP
jgi:hypothetical protein